MGVPHFRDSRTKQSYFIFIRFSTSASNGIDGIPPKFSTHSDAAAFANPAYSAAISNVIFSIDSFDWLVCKMESETDGAVKYKIFRYVGGFPDGETHEFDEFGILCRIPAEETEFRPDQQDQSAHGIAHFRGFDGRL